MAGGEICVLTPENGRAQDRQQWQNRRARPSPRNSLPRDHMTTKGRSLRQLDQRDCNPESFGVLICLSAWLRATRENYFFGESHSVIRSWVSMLVASLRINPGAMDTKNVSKLTPSRGCRLPVESIVKLRPEFML